jgi:archaellin
MDITKFIGVYDNVLSLSTCNTLISYMNSGSNKIKKQTAGDNLYNENIRKGYEAFLQFPKHNVIKEDLINGSFYAIGKYLNQTKGYSDFIKHNADKCLFENFRIRMYKKNDGFFKEHSDIINKATSTRLFVIMFYLNTVERGGETEFTNINLSIKPKQGSCIIFHPNFMFPHQSKIPISYNKYTAQTYLHYN